MTRPELIEAVARIRLSKQRPASDIIDVVLDAAIAELVKAKLGDDWNGSRALQGLYDLRGGRPT